LERGSGNLERVLSVQGGKRVTEGKAMRGQRDCYQSGQIDGGRRDWENGLGETF